jgi:[NiFe] hydrogenase diaphorase moiety large subunit
MSTTIKQIIRQYDADPTRLMDILTDVQAEYGYIPEDAVGLVSELCNIARVDVEQTISFYHFFSQTPRGTYTIYLNNSVVAKMMGSETIAKEFEKQVGIPFNNVSPDGRIGLFETACIGMNDQEPAAIINGVIFPRLTTFRVKEIVRDIRLNKSVDELRVQSFGDGHNLSDQIRSTVLNNIRKKGPVILSDYESGAAIKKAVMNSPEAVIAEIKNSNMRGRGGAGFPTGLKWEFCRKVESDEKYVFCNADEGEPGTFKDRVILTEYPRHVFEGMILAGYAISAAQGILYIRHEYLYLKNYLHNVLLDMEKENLLGKNIAGKRGFNFTIRIQYGAGAYVCGEESALIESAEGKRGEPRDRPPFPVEKGYLEKPTIVNNVETLLSAVKIIYHGAAWYKSFGTKASSGTKVLSISGDCKFPGVYEVEWGFSVHDILEMAGADSGVGAVQVGGPSGACIGPAEFHRVLAYEDLATGGSIIIFNENRDLLREVVLNFTDFFIEESCGSCAPCRVLPLIYKKKLEKIIGGRGTAQDLADITSWSSMMAANRCGLGQTALNPILSTLKNFPQMYRDRIKTSSDFETTFDLDAAVAQSCAATGRIPALKETL